MGALGGALGNAIKLPFNVLGAIGAEYGAVPEEIRTRQAQRQMQLAQAQAMYGAIQQIKDPELRFAAMSNLAETGKALASNYGQSILRQGDIVEHGQGGPITAAPNYTFDQNKGIPVMQTPWGSTFGPSTGATTAISPEGVGYDPRGSGPQFAIPQYKTHPPQDAADYTNVVPSVPFTGVSPTAVPLAPQPQGLLGGAPGADPFHPPPAGGLLPSSQPPPASPSPATGLLPPPQTQTSGPAASPSMPGQSGPPSPAPSMGRPDLDSLVQMVWGESRGESPQAQQATAATAINRARATGQTVAQAIAHGGYEGFNAQAKALSPSDPRYIKIAQNIAPMFAGGNFNDPTGGATHFLNPALQQQLGRPMPAWAQQGGGQQFGHQVFYRRPDLLGGGAPTGPSGGPGPSPILGDPSSAPRLGAAASTVTPISPGIRARVLSPTEVASMGQAPGTVMVQAPDGSITVPATRAASELPKGDEDRLNDLRTTQYKISKLAALAQRFAQLQGSVRTGGVQAIPGVADVEGAFDPKVAELNALSKEMIPLQREVGSGPIRLGEIQGPGGGIWGADVPDVKRPGPANSQMAGQWGEVAKQTQDYINFAENWAQSHPTLNGADAAWAAQNGGQMFRLGGGGSGGAGGQPVVLNAKNADASYAQLAPGALFVAPDGTTRRKPAGR